MYLTAISMGKAFPDTDFEAAVHSVFRSAVNLRPVDADLLLTLVAAGQADLPQGIRAATPLGFSFEALRAGGRVFCLDRRLEFENSSLTVDLTGARRWKCDLPEVDLSEAAVVAAWEAVWTRLNARQLRLGAEIVADDLVGKIGKLPGAGVPRKAAENVLVLLQATRKLDLEAASAARALIGLGSGLTPAGDDLLVGYLAGLFCTVWERPGRQEFVSGLGREIIRWSDRTNDISRTYLYHAARGQVSSRLAALATAIGAGENFLAAADTAFNAGHTSGLDTVTGLLVGLAAWGTRWP